VSLAAPEEMARSIALKALDRAARSRAQLEQLLSSRGIPPQVAAGVLDRFEAVGLVDDQALAQALVRARHGERGLAGRALMEELSRKGIDPATAAAAVAQVTPEDEAAAARRVARQRLRASAGLPRQTRLRRATAALVRKGHPPGAAYAAVQRLLAEEADQAGGL
jgi:regulatory protein